MTNSSAASDATETLSDWVVATVEDVNRRWKSVRAVAWFNPCLGARSRPDTFCRRTDRTTGSLHQRDEAFGQARGGVHLSTEFGRGRSGVDGRGGIGLSDPADVLDGGGDGPDALGLLH